MKPQKDRHSGSGMTYRGAARIAVMGAGVAGSTCARELRLHGYDPVVFEASDRVGGRCSSRSTRIGWFDDAAQAISGATCLTTYAVRRLGKLAAVHPWTVPETPAESQSKAKDRDKDEVAQEDANRPVNLIGAVGVPSMLAQASAVARPLDVRLRTPIQRTQRRGAAEVGHRAQALPTTSPPRGCTRSSVG